MFSFKKEKYAFNLSELNIDDQKHKERANYTAIFRNTSDSSFLWFVLEKWGYNPQYCCGKYLKEVNPKLHYEISTHKFLEEFKTHIALQHISEIKQLFYEFEDPQAELGYFNDYLKDFKNSISENTQKQNITSLSRKYIDEVSLQLTQLREWLFNKFQHKKEIMEDNTPKHPFVTETLEEIIYPDNINNILDFEKRLIKDGYFDKNYVWKNEYGSQKKLILFCLVLIKKGYTKKFNKHKKKIKPKEVFNFFSNRYNIKLGDLTKPNKFNKYNLEGEYTFIDKPKN